MEVDVRRGHVLDDALRGHKIKFDTGKVLKVFLLLMTDYTLHVICCMVCCNQSLACLHGRDLPDYGYV